MDTRNQGKFAEPRGWALKWVLTEERAHPAVEQETENGCGVWDRFAEPRGWAVKWDGSALSEADERT